MASYREIKRRLFAGEHEIRSLGSLTLTSHRVILYSRGPGRETSTSVELGHVQWTRVQRLDRRAVGSLLAALVIAAAGASSFEAWIVVGVLAGLATLSAALLLSLRPARLVIGAGAGRLVLPLVDSTERCRQARDFADAIEHAAADVARGRPILRAV